MPDDIVILVADKNTDYGMRGLLSRPKALGIRPIQARILVHPGRDPGCAREAEKLLRPLAHQYQHALVIFDHRGSGQEALRADALSDDVRDRLAAAGWGDRAETIVIDPELEIWVFAQSPNVERCLGWRGARGTLRRWLEHENLWRPDQPKPGSPKEALDRVLFRIRRPRSSSVYQCLGERVSVKGCTERAFIKLGTTLSAWFPADDAR